MKKIKTIRPLAVTAMDTLNMLARPLQALEVANDVSEMTSFVCESAQKLVYIDGKPSKRLSSFEKNGETFIGLDTLSLFGYQMTTSRAVMRLQGVNNLVIDVMTLKTKLNDVNVPLNIVQVNNVLYVGLREIEELTGATALIKNNSLFLTTSDKSFVLENGVAQTTVVKFDVDGSKLYTSLISVLAAFPSFVLRDGMLCDTLTTIQLKLSDFEKDAKFRIMDIVIAAGGTAVMMKHDGQYTLVVKLASTDLVAAENRQMDFSRSLAVAPIKESTNVEEAILNEINAYREASGQSLVTVGGTGETKGQLCFAHLSNIPKMIYLAMADEASRKLLMGNIRSIFVRDVKQNVEIYAYA